MKKVRNLRLEHFETNSSFYLLYAWLCISGVLAQWMIQRLQHIDFIWILNHWTRTSDIHNYAYSIKSLNSFQTAQSSDFRVLGTCKDINYDFIKSKHKIQNINTTSFHPLFQKKDMGSILCKWNRLKLQLLWNFMITDYNYNYFFSKCNRLQLQITLKKNHDYFMITFDYF